MKIKVLKVIILTLICTLLISLSVLPCFADGLERDPYDVIIADDVLSTSLDWDVTFTLDFSSPYGDSSSTAVNFKLDPVFPIISLPDGWSTNISSNTTETTSSEIDMPNAGYQDNITFDLTTSYVYDHDNPGFVDIQYNWGTSHNEGYSEVTAVQFQAQRFYYTYDPTIVPAIEGVGGPFGLYFEGASSVTTIVYYHELGNAIDSYSVSYTSENSESTFSPSLFGYSDDDSFTLFIDRVIVIPEYGVGAIDGYEGIDIEYGYDGAYSQFSRASDLNTHITPPSDEVFADYTSWIGLAVSGFLDFQIFPGFSIGGLLMVIISFTTVIWFLKLFAGG